MDNTTNSGFGNKTTFYAVIAVLCGVVVMLVFLLAQYSNSAIQTPRSAANGNVINTVAPSTRPAYSPSSIPTPLPFTPESVTKAFYDWYFTYPSDPLISGAYKNSGYLTTDFISIMSDLLQAYNKTTPYDPIFCVKNKTHDITVGAAEYIDTTAGRLANVRIYRKHDGKAIYRAVLVFADNSWRIKDIICVP